MVLQVNQVKSVMMQNIEKVMQRGEKLEVRQFACGTAATKGRHRPELEVAAAGIPRLCRCWWTRQSNCRAQPRTSPARASSCGEPCGGRTAGGSLTCGPACNGVSHAAALTSRVWPQFAVRRMKLCALCTLIILALVIFAVVCFYGGNNW